MPAVREVARISSRQCEPRVSECTCGERDHVLSGTAWLAWLLGACPDRRGRAGGVGRCKRQVSGVKGRLVGAHEQRPPRAIGADGASSGPAEAGAGASSMSVHVALIDRGSRLSSNQACHALVVWRRDDNPLPIAGPRPVGGHHLPRGRQRRGVLGPQSSRTRARITDDAIDRRAGRGTPDQLARRTRAGTRSGRPTLDLGSGPVRFTAALRARDRPHWAWTTRPSRWN